MTDQQFLRGLSDDMPLATAERLLLIADNIDKLKKSNADAGWRESNLRERQRYDSYGNPDGYYQ